MNTDRRKTVLIDDDCYFRAMMESFIADLPVNFESRASFPSSFEFTLLSKCAAIIVDYHMDPKSRVYCAEMVRRYFPTLPAVIVSLDVDALHDVPVGENGIIAALDKNLGPLRLFQGLVDVLHRFLPEIEKPSPKPGKVWI